MTTKGKTKPKPAKKGRPRKEKPTAEQRLIEAGIKEAEQHKTLEQMQKELKPKIPTDLNGIIIMQEFERIRLYLFEFVYKLTEIKDEITQVKLLVQQQQPHVQAAFTPIPAFKIPSVFSPDKSDYIRKNMAQILKFMVPKGAVNVLPKEVMEAYHNILGTMAAPNDPVWDDQKPPDPREPVNDPNLTDELYDTPEGKDESVQVEEPEEQEEPEEEPETKSE